MKRCFALGKLTRALKEFTKEGNLAINKRILKGFYTHDKIELEDSQNAKTIKTHPIELNADSLIATNFSKTRHLFKATKKKKKKKKKVRWDSIEPSYVPSQYFDQEIIPVLADKPRLNKLK